MATARRAHERTAEQTTRTTWPRLSLALSLTGGVSLVATNALAASLLDLVGESGFLASSLVAIVLFAAGFVVSAVWFFARLAEGRVDGVVPLAICLTAATLCVNHSVAYQLDALDFRARHAARVGIVERVEAGELWSGSPSDSVAFLPREYPTSVSNGAGQRSIVVYRAADALRVVFYPTTGLLAGLLRERPAFIYSSDAAPPSLPDAVLPNAILRQELGEGWYRVTFR